MSLGMESSSQTSFIDRRNRDGADTPARERRQFTDARTLLSPDAQELASAIDSYKLVHRRRFITYEEMMTVIKELGYHK